jgi:hypothetical protein
MSLSLPPRAMPVLQRDLSEGISEGGFSVNWFGFFKSIASVFASGFTGTIVTAKLTGGGTEGSITFQNGVVVSQVAAT